MSDKNKDNDNTDHKTGAQDRGKKLRRQLIRAAVAVVALAAIANGVPAPIPDNPVSRMVGGVLTEVFNNRVADGLERVAEMTGDAIEKARAVHEEKSQAGHDAKQTVAMAAKKTQMLKA